jgi:hypothetical protein
MLTPEPGAVASAMTSRHRPEATLVMLEPGTAWAGKAIAAIPSTSAAIDPATMNSNLGRR